MRNDFCIFILTHGRPNRQQTYDLLKKLNYKGKLYLIVDDQDESIEEYKNKYNEIVIVFNKEKAIAETDTMDNLNYTNSVVFARNESFNIARRLGIKYFLMLDDDYISINYKFDDKNLYISKATKNINKIIKHTLDYYISSNALTISFSQGGDFIGGGNGTFEKSIFLKRKAMNSFFCSTERPLKFTGRINEDVNMYCLYGSTGRIIFQIPQISITQNDTQQNAGGLTDIYLKIGTYIKSFYSVMCCPSFVKIAMMNSENTRIHHNVIWENACAKIISEKHVK